MPASLLQRSRAPPGPHLRRRPPHPIPVGQRALDTSLGRRLRSRGGRPGAGWVTCPEAATPGGGRCLSSLGPWVRDSLPIDPRTGHAKPSTSLTRPAPRHDRGMPRRAEGTLKRRQLVKKTPHRGTLHSQTGGERARGARGARARWDFFSTLPRLSSPWLLFLRACLARPPLPPRGAPPRCRPPKRASCGPDPGRAGLVGPWRFARHFPRRRPALEPPSLPELAGVALPARRWRPW